MMEVLPGISNHSPCHRESHLRNSRSSHHLFLGHGRHPSCHFFRRCDGQRWTKLSPGASFKQVTSLDFVSSTLGWAIGGQGKNSSRLLKTTDGGQTWTPIPSTIS